MKLGKRLTISPLDSIGLLRHKYVEVKPTGGWFIPSDVSALLAFHPNEYQMKPWMNDSLILVHNGKGEAIFPFIREA